MLDVRSAFLLILVLISIAVLVGFVEWRQRGLACTTCGKSHRHESEVFTCESCGRSFCRSRTIFQRPDPGVLAADSYPPRKADRQSQTLRGERSAQFAAFNYTGLAADAEDWCGKIEIFPSLPEDSEEETPHYFCWDCAQRRLT